MPSPVLTAVQRAVRRPLAWKRHRAVRPHDVLLGSYPRSGGTWLAIMLAEYLTGDSFDLRSGDDALPMVGEGRPAISLPGGGRLLRSHERHRREYRHGVVLIRDPRDVAVSYFHFQHDRLGRFSGDISEFVDRFVNGTVDHYGAWDKHVASWLDGGDDRVLVRYEDLLADTTRELERILTFLGLEPNSVTVAAVASANSFLRMREKEQRSTEATPDDQPDSARFVRSGRVGGWAGELDQRSLEQLERRLATTMRRLGYEPTTT